MRERDKKIRHPPDSEQIGTKENKDGTGRTEHCDEVAESAVERFQRPTDLEWRGNFQFFHVLTERAGELEEIHGKESSKK